MQKNRPPSNLKMQDILENDAKLVWIENSVLEQVVPQDGDSAQATASACGSAFNGPRLDSDSCPADRVTDFCLRPFAR